MNRKQNQLAGVTKAVFMLFVAFVVQLITQVFVLSYFGASYSLYKGRNLQYTEISKIMDKLMANTTVMMMLMVTVAAVNALVFGLWYYLSCVRGKENWEKGYVSVKYLPILLLIAIGLQLFMSVGLSLIEEWQPAWFKEYNELMESLTIKGNLAAMAYVVLIGPVSEELIFRGAIMGKMENYMDFTMANVVQALCFGVYHMNLIQGIYAFGIGMVLGYVCHRCKTIFASVSLHILFNAASVVILYLGGEEAELSGSVTAVMVAGGLLIAVMMLFAFHVVTKKEQEENA